MNALEHKTRVVCVDDNKSVGDALSSLLATSAEFELDEWLEDADALTKRMRTECPQLVLLDLDMPGTDPLEVLSELTGNCTDTRVIIFTGHVRRELIDRAVEAGAWGYVSKNDGEIALLSVMRKVMGGEFSLSREAREVYE